MQSNVFRFRTTSERWPRAYRLTVAIAIIFIVHNLYSGLTAAGPVVPPHQSATVLPWEQMGGHPGLQRRITTFSTDQDAAQILAFYHQQLAASGWTYACDGHVPGCGWGQLSGSLSHDVYRRQNQLTASTPTFEVIIMPTAAGSERHTSLLLYETRAR